MTDFQTDPSRYAHWQLTIDGPVARLNMNVDPEKTFRPGYKLKLNSYDLGVDIELADAVQRLRFEHPGVKVVIIGSANPRVFCAGANITMLGLSSHPFKVNFCKYTNETRCAIEDATAHSGQTYIAALGGTASGGGYELAAACEEIYLLDDGNSAVSLPEVPLLGVLPGTGGLTRLVDKRKIRRDHADIFSTLAEGLKARKAREWNLIDGAFPRSRFEEEIAKRAAQLAAAPSPKDGARGITLTPIVPRITLAAPGQAFAAIAPCARPLDAASGIGDGAAAGPRVARPAPPQAESAPASAAGLEDGSRHATVILEYEHVTLVCDRAKRLATLTVHAPEGPQPESVGAIHEAGAAFWALAAFRELDDALCRLRLDEEEIGLVLLKTAPARLAAGPGASPPASGRLSRGSGAAPAADSALDAGFEAAEAACSSLLKLDQVLAANRSDWLVNEIVLHMARVLRRLDLTAKSLFAVVEPGSCFAGPLLELALAADRIYMKNDATSPAFLRIGSLSGGHLPMPHGLTRLQSRLLADPARAEALSNDRTRFDAPAALAAGLVTVAPDELDWDDELRLAVEERLSLSPDALTGMEASLRFGGPETADSKIYGRLSAWQNWIFIRPNATGEHGALKLYGQPERPKFDWRRT